MVPEGWKARIVARCSSEQALRYAITEGDTKPPHVLAGGKAILSELPDKLLTRSFDETRGQRETLTQTTTTAHSKLRKQIAIFREQGSATAIYESTVSISSIARPICLGDTVGALSIAMPSIRFLPELQNRSVHALKRAVISLCEERYTGCNWNKLERLVAEREGFEPSIRLPVYRISSAAHSTTLPPLRMYRVRFRAQGPGRSEGAD